ncbi:HlyD family efflux transporter periplasmic adaptor subunit [Paraneptunicella aestuarii]|uniref:HlyD family efflux transporter periplasmic adaptor subunit n=1 Tax=Paraneptunicella aestuarii TaxID=2831148 RepID=UPI001E2E4329|nr:HlyD family efflux transporter periplasmic adaptor subunit [Paraneptunicella aestuarii]UAA38027.1 HlyD family efflux transporter periplasmic adaptor subunit [Paraneptunicella aestuarii]
MKFVIKLLCGLSVVGVIAYFAMQDTNALVFDNAYISGRTLTITANNNGRLELIGNLKDKRLKKGQIIAYVNPTINELEIDELQEELRLSLNEELKTCLQKDVTVLKRTVEELDLELSQKKLKRLTSLSKTAAVSDEAVDQADIEFHRSQQLIKIREKEHQIDTLDNHFEILQRPRISLLLARLKKAFFTREQLIIRAPYDGYVYEYYVYNGQQVELGDKLVLFVPKEDMIVEANVLESKLDMIRPNDPVEVTSFVFGKERIFEGSIISVVPSATSTFAGLPRNISDSNWVKVEQRVPVRILLQGSEKELDMLPIGSSVEVKMNLEQPTHYTSVQASSEPEPAAPTELQLGINAAEPDPKWLREYKDRLSLIIDETRKAQEAVSPNECVI